MKIFSTILFWMYFYNDILNSECFIVNKHKDLPLSTLKQQEIQVFESLSMDFWSAERPAEIHGPWISSLLCGENFTEPLKTILLRIND